MSIRNGIYDFLSAAESAVYPLAAPQGTEGTYIVYFIRREGVRTQSGISMYNVFLTLHIYATELDTAETMSATMEAALENGSGTYDSEVLQVCNWISSEDGEYMPDLDKFTIIQEYQLYFE